MGIPGRKPKPTELRIVEGNRAHRPLPKPVKTAPLLPPCPQWLSPIAKTEWKRAAPLLHKLGLLAREDMAAFAGYCENYAVVTQCANYIKRKGGYAKYLCGKNSQTVPHLVAMNRAWQNLRAFCAEFGLSPSARGRMEVPDAGEDEDEDLD